MLAKVNPAHQARQRGHRLGGARSDTLSQVAPGRRGFLSPASGLREALSKLDIKPGREGIALEIPAAMPSLTFFRNFYLRNT